MNLRKMPEADSFAGMIKAYADADEWVFAMCSQYPEDVVTEICREAHRLVHQIRSHFGDRPPAALAEVYGVEISEEHWQTAEGQIAYLAECTIVPPKIRLNLESIHTLVRYCQWNAPEAERRWFTELKIMETVIAHELYHIINHSSSSPSAELSAHSFARELVGLPFSPILYQELLKEATR